MTKSARVDPEIVRPSDVQAEPWANGLGVTRVLATRPAWRISVAEIEGTTPFSSFAGMDRVLIPLSPSGVAIDIGSTRHRVRAGEPIAFAGEDAVVGVAGMRRTTVLNIMTVRSAARASIDVVRGAEVETAGADALLVLGGVVTASGAALPSGTLVLPGTTPSALSAARGVIALVTWRSVSDDEGLA